MIAIPRISPLPSTTTLTSNAPPVVLVMETVPSESPPLYFTVVQGCPARMESKSGGVRTTGAVGPKCSAISSWVNGVLVLNALRSQVICLPTELSGIVTVAGAAVGGGLCAVFRGLCGISPGSTCGEGEYRCGGKCYQRERATLPACVFEFHGLISSASSSARVRLRCRHTQPEVLNRFILEYRQLLVVVTHTLQLDKWEKGLHSKNFRDDCES